MVTVYDVEPNKLIAKAAEKLGEIGIKMPESLRYAKSGCHAERLPEQKDFWQVRCASLLRNAYVREKVGVASLRTHYGGRKNRGVMPERHVDAGGAVIRRGFQQLEKIGLIAKDKTGRKITGKGKAFLDAVAKEVASAKVQ